MPLIVDILTEELYNNPELMAIKKIKKYKGFHIKRDIITSAYIITVAANNRKVEKTFYDRDIIKEDVRGETFKRILNEIHDALIS